MILTDDTEKDAKVTKGQRTLAKEFFQDKDVKPRVRTWLMNTTVLFTSKRGDKGSGVIIAVDLQKVYVLTAKHLLYKLSSQDSPPAGTKPADYNNKTFFDKLQIGYQPAGFEGKTAKTAAVTGLNFKGSDDQKWLYDIVIFESTDADFRTFAQPLVFIDAQLEKKNKTYATLLSVKQKGCDALDTEKYEFFQLGYGDGRTKTWQATMAEGYTDYGGKLQCKISTPTDKTLIDGAFEPDARAADKWPRSNQICMMNANVTNTSGPGDSGGPLFSRLKTDKNQFYLVGVTTGANFFSDPKYVQGQKARPANNVVHNNAVTYWKAVFDAWPWT